MGNKNKTLKSRKLWGIVLSVGIMLNTLIVQAEEVVPIQTQIVVEIGEQKKISITKEKNLKWLSGNKEVATVDSNDIWEIKPEKGKSFWIPNIESVVQKVDLANKRIEVTLLEGLRDEN